MVQPRAMRGEGRVSMLTNRRDVALSACCLPSCCKTRALINITMALRAFASSAAVGLGLRCGAPTGFTAASHLRASLARGYSTGEIGRHCMHVRLDRHSLPDCARPWTRSDRTLKLPPAPSSQSWTASSTPSRTSTPRSTATPPFSVSLILLRCAWVSEIGRERPSEIP